jgi:LAO/AO transport system kinase
MADRTGPGHWRPRVVRTVATTGSGVDQLVAAVEDHRSWLGVEGLRARRVRRAAREIEGLALEALRTRVGGLRGDTRLDALADEVVGGRTDPYAAADRLVASLT